jgi:hypothetical protein
VGGGIVEGKMKEHERDKRGEMTVLKYGGRQRVMVVVIGIVANTVMSTGYKPGLSKKHEED